MNYQPTSIELPLTLIRPTSGWIPLRLRDLWEYRELIYFLAWRDLKVRYRQTTLGITWVVLQPLLMTIVFGLFFGRFAAIPSDTIDIPHPVFAFCGLLTWQFFSYVLVNSSNSLVASERLITKIYFPRLVIPLSGMLSGLVDFAIGLLFSISHHGLVWNRASRKYMDASAVCRNAHGACGRGRAVACGAQPQISRREARHSLCQPALVFRQPRGLSDGFYSRRVALGVRCQSNGRRDPRSSLVPSE